MGVRRDREYPVMDIHSFYDKYIRGNFGAEEQWECMADLKEVVKSHGGEPRLSSQAAVEPPPPPPLQEGSTGVVVEND